MHADLVLVGFGHVGRRFARLLDEQRERLAADHGLTCRIVGISTRRHGVLFDSDGVDVLPALLQVEAGASLWQSDIDVIARLGEMPNEQAVGRDALRVVVETTTLDIENGQPAIEHVRRAIDAGCHVITANKGPAAFAYRALRDEADAAGLSFLFEGAVMDGVPVFNLVRETLPNINIEGFRGVVNATTNHILSALEDGEAFAPALARMQALGIAEADATLDVDGWDAAAKAAALANVLMDARMTPRGVDRTGIGESTAAAALRARAGGRRLRLVASARRLPDGSVEAAVAPVELPADDLLAGLRGQANALILDTDLLGRIAITQLDGSLTQTAYALLSDLVTVARRARSAT
jgi:homoserine dehydrogenase